MYRSKFILSPYNGTVEWVSLGRYFEKCTKVFTYANLFGFTIMHDEKNRSMKHGGGDIAKYGDHR
jgi:hypothetical protein